MEVLEQGDILDHYIRRAVYRIRGEKRRGKSSIARVWFMRHLYLHNEPDFYDDLIAALIAKGILVPKGKRLMIGVLPVPTVINHLTVKEVVDHEFAEKSAGEKAATVQSTALSAQSNRAREARRTRRAAAMMRRMK